MSEVEELLSELGRLHASATPGPWEAEGSLLWCVEDHAENGRYGSRRDRTGRVSGKKSDTYAPIADFDDDEYVSSPRPAEDAAFTAAAKNAFPQLLALLRTQQQRIEDAELALNVWDETHSSEYWLRHPEPAISSPRSAE